MITKDLLDQLKAERLRPRYENQLTPFGNVVVQVHSELENKREKFIAQGEQTLQKALENFRREQKLAAIRGLRRNEFNADAANNPSNQPEKTMEAQNGAACQPETITIHRITSQSLLDALQQHRSEQGEKQNMSSDAHSPTQERSISHEQ